MDFDKLIHVLLIALLPPLLLGVVNRTKASFAGRRGPPLLQPYFDILRLLRKGMVISNTTTALFLLGPAAALAGTLTAAVMLPLGHHAPPVAFAGDMVVFVYLLALGRFFTATAALDTGSPFEGMGAAREVSFAWLAEPCLFLGFVALARMTGSVSLSGMLSGTPLAGPSAGVGAVVLIVCGWFVVLLAENCRIPFDDPNTHLELTMIHEVMVLDHSGPALGAILYGAALKFFLFAALIVDLVLPAGADAWGGWLSFVAGVFLVAILVGVVESIMARLRLPNVPKLLVSASLLAAFAVVFATT